MKEEHEEYACKKFQGTGIQITTEGKRHLGAVVGTEDFKQEYVKAKVDSWIEELEELEKIARIEPHIAYCAYVKGFQSKYTHVLRTIPGIEEHLHRLDDAIDLHVLKPILNYYQFSKLERVWFSLPPRLGGLGINMVSEIAPICYQNSKLMTANLVDRIVQQHSSDISEQENGTQQVKLKIKDEKTKREDGKVEFVKSKLNPYLLRVYEAITEKGASSWLNAMPLKQHDFYLNKQTFWDTLYLRYGIPLPRLPTTCVCDAKFSIEHALNCKKGGFVTMRHNNIRDFTAYILSEVCNDVALEPLLTPLSGEVFKKKSTATEDNARLDCSVRGFYIKGNKLYLDVKVFNPLAKVYSNQTLKASHNSNEKDKKRKYEDRILEVEHGSFTPLIFSCLGGMSVECTHFYNRLADKYGEKKNLSISKARTWLRTKLSFCLLRSTHMCIRGSRTRKQHTDSIENLADTNVPLALEVAQLEGLDL